MLSIKLISYNNLQQNINLCIVHKFLLGRISCSYDDSYTNSDSYI